MPQLDPTHFANQIFWLVVTLAVIFFVLKLVALPRIGGTLATRRGTIVNDLAAAEELKQKAVAAEKAYNDALVAARAEAGKIVTAAKAEIQADLNKAIADERAKTGKDPHYNFKLIADKLSTLIGGWRTLKNMPMQSTYRNVIGYYNDAIGYMNRGFDR